MMPYPKIQECNNWSDINTLYADTTLVNGKKYEIRKDSHDKLTTYQLYNRISSFTTIKLVKYGEIQIRDCSAEEITFDEDLRRKIEESFGNLRVTYISFLNPSVNDIAHQADYGMDEIKALIWTAFKHSKQVGNEGRLCINCNKSDALFYKTFLKEATPSKGNKVFLYLQKDNIDEFKKEMKENVQKLKVIKKCDSGNLAILACLSAIALLHLSTAFSVN